MPTPEGNDATARPLLFELRGVHLRRGDTTVFEGLDLEVGAGTQTAILGPNGAGKSSLIQLLTRDLYPLFRQETTLRILGQDRWRVWELKQRLGIVSADLQLRHRRVGGEEPMAQLTGLEIAISGFEGTIGLHPHLQTTEAQRERAAATLDQLGASHLADRVFDTFSTGEQRRVLLARALVHDPETLVLDEPTAGLDLRARFELLSRLRELAQKGRTLVLVTHMVGEVLPEITHLILLDRGRVAAAGPKEDVLTAENLERLYGVPLELVERGGWYDVLPGQLNEG